MQNIVVFSGAGMSAESGLSTFRDGNGLWDKYPIEEVATPEIIEGAQKLVSRQSAYLCGVCGFHGPSFYWQCPGCKSWDTLHRPVR